MVPAAGKRLRGRFRILEIALHDEIAAEHDLAHRLLVPGHRLHARRIEHRDRFLRVVAHSLPAIQLNLFGHRQNRPVGVFGADRRRPVGFGQTVHMCEIDADIRHRLDDCGWWRRGSDQAGHLVRDAGTQFGRRIGHQAVHDRCATVVGHAVCANRFENQFRIDTTQTDVGASIGGHRPDEAPAIAMEHRQRPQIDRMRRHSPADDVAHRVEIGTAMMVNDALRIAGGSGSVVERDGIPFVGRATPGKLWTPVGNELLVLLRAEAFSGAAVLGIVDIDHQDLAVQNGQRPFHGR
ncbi:MAG: hypothetical protein AW09_004651 [Candidatus Accumulibacter phosphatis]|uniref:Uncharacterized protein n=1 Tax=Candidatus Accumulibacter phosphatis TaxID=327160 RepID=A0A084Y6D1_9PROT|nr:MAG: hypothetical protein AW09_004651 [Candidatus Accumulibacter phosphatis]